MKTTFTHKKVWVGYSIDGAEHMQRIGLVLDDDLEPIQYGPEFPPSWLDMALCAIIGMEPIQECHGCMSWLHPKLLTLKSTGSLLCEECMEAESY